MTDEFIKKSIDKSIFIMIVFFIGYAIYASSNEKTFDNKCTSACSPARSMTPVIEFENKCLCDEGGGKWSYQDVN